MNQAVVGYWSFEEGQGDTVYDLSGNENDGIINGATYKADVPEQSCQLTTAMAVTAQLFLNSQLLNQTHLTLKLQLVKAMANEHILKVVLSNIQKQNVNYSMNFEGTDHQC